MKQVLTKVEQEDIDLFFRKGFKSPFLLSLERAWLKPLSLCKNVVETRHGIELYFIGEKTNLPSAQIVYPSETMEIYDKFDKYKILYSDIYYDVLTYHEFRIQDAMDLVDAYKEIKDQKPFEFKAEVDEKVMRKV